MVALNYSLAEIKALDDQFKARPSHSLALVSFDGLPETLRAIGRRIDEEEGQLLRVCNSSFPSLNETITIEYRSRERLRRELEIPVAEIRDHAVRMYKKRSSIRGGEHPTGETATR